MKKIIIIFLFLASFYQANAGNFIYPFDKVAVPKCRFSNWSSLGDDCKMSIPRIKDANYTNFKFDTTYRKIYSILWGATYNYGWDVGNGSHPGIDIATSAGTPIRSIGDGEIITAGWLSGWGNTVVIKHKLNNGNYIYSNYAHLSKITTKKGVVKAGDMIGEVGATGNSYGNHVHFQIDIGKGTHPYWFPSSCSKGISDMSLVNNGKCRESLLENTIDPIIFLENNGEFQDISSIKVKQEQTVKIDSKNIVSRQQILDEEVEEFMKTHSINLNTQVAGNNMQVGLNYITKLSVNYYNSPFSGNLPETGLTFEYDSSALKIFPDKILTIDSGARDIIITGLKSGKYSINIKIGKKIVGSINLNLYKNNELSNPSGAEIMSKSKIAIGDEKLGGVVFKTKFGSNQISIPYNGVYKLKSLSGKVKFCNVSNKPIKKCSYTELTYELNFKYSDTYYGALAFNMIPLDYLPIKLALIKVGEKIPMAENNTQINVCNPINLDSTYPYFNENINTLKKGYLRLTNGYLLQEREILGNQVKEIIGNFLSYEFLKSGDDLAKKAIIMNKLKQVNSNISSLNNFGKITRGDFIKILFDNFGIPLVKNNNKVFFDEKGNYKDYITTLREKYNFSWKDQFGSQYFQPDKNITVGETLFITDIINKGYGAQFVFNSSLN